ncbi:MAG TPA: ATP-binding protein [Mycobacteriales bacterium]|jgi:two-component system sensor histidine kinase BaeS|nr:ATP-binding protein [Mycobacteriales bacterium]
MTNRSLAARLALSFVSVAVLAVAIGAALAVVLSGHDINVMVQDRRTDLTRSLLVDAASTYNSGQPGWSDADLRPALDLASQSGTDVAVLDDAGHTVASTIADPTRAAEAHRTPISLNGARIGTLVVRFNQRGLVQSANNLRTSLSKAVIGAAGLAAVLALAIGLLVARRLTRPVERLIAASRAMTEGDRAARVGPLVRTPRELQNLGIAFDQMADTLGREEQIRRGVVADVAHELRTPVAILQANTEALVDGVVEHTPQQTMSLHEEVLRLAAMVDDLQSLASAEAAALNLRLARCDLATVVNGSLDSLGAQLAVAGLELECRIESAPVVADAARLHQVATNILGNAIKFTPPGGRITVAVAKAGGEAKLEVSDTGVGIAAAERDHVFERFWRGRDTGDVAGSGIGLSVVAELVRAHHGTVDVGAAIGGGTRVTVTIPSAPPGG